MVFLFSGPESGHTERRARAKMRVAATVLFHPDFNRRLRSCTESADPSSEKKKALAGLGFSTLTAGGDFHPALRTSAARHGRPEGTMPARHGIGKRDQLSHAGHDGAASSCHRFDRIRLAAKLTIVARHLPIPFCSNR
jgi:hypothetical protein